MYWDILNESRNDLVKYLGIKDSVFDKLIGMYVDNNLPYHNLSHIAECLKLYNDFKHLSETHYAVHSAIWFHDAIYVPGNSDNELKSAEFAEKVLIDNALSKGFSKHVREMIVGAVHNNVSEDKDTRLLRDIDFSMFGMPWNKYINNSKRIAVEYSAYPEYEFLKGRKQFLEQVLFQPIFLNEEFVSEYGLNAKENVIREIMLINRDMLNRKGKW